MTTLTKHNILNIINNHREMLARFGVSTLGLFGSTVRDEAHDQSDIDLLVTFQPGQKTFDNFMGLAFFLEDLLGKRVELVTPESLSQSMRAHVMQEAEYATLVD